LVRKQHSKLKLTDTQWHQIILDYTPAAGNQLDLGIFARNVAPRRALYVDDVSLVETSRRASSPTQASKPNDQPKPKPSDTGTAPAPPSSTPAPAPTKSEPVASLSTLFGTATFQNPGETWSDAIARRDRELGRAKIMRVFYPGLPQDWPGRAGQI